MPVIVVGRLGMHGQSVQHLVEEDTDIDPGKFGRVMSQNVLLKHVPVVTWDLIMIIHAMQFVTMDPIQEGHVAVQQDGMETVATTVCILSYACFFNVETNLNIAANPYSNYV